MNLLRPLFLLLLLSALAFGWNQPKDEPPKEVKLEEKPLEAMSDQELDDLGERAMAIATPKWRHAETPNFIVHFRRATEARRAVREIEYNLWFVAKALGATPEQYAKKSHVFIFQDRPEWVQFLHRVGAPPWAASFARGPTLYLNIGGPSEPFDSKLLAHETTHAVVARLYPDRRWPLWLNEGFAEYMGSATIAARRGQTLRGLQNKLSVADHTLPELLELAVYPTDRKEIDKLYQSSERFVRFIMTQYPKEQFPKLVEVLLNGDALETSIPALYGESFADFTRRYDRFK